MYKHKPNCESIDGVWISNRARLFSLAQRCPFTGRGIRLADDSQPPAHEPSGAAQTQGHPITAPISSKASKPCRIDIWHRTPPPPIPSAATGPRKGDTYALREVARPGLERRTRTCVCVSSRLMPFKERPRHFIFRFPSPQPKRPPIHAPALSPRPQPIPIDTAASPATIDRCGGRPRPPVSRWLGFDALTATTAYALGGPPRGGEASRGEQHFLCFLRGHFYAPHTHRGRHRRPTPRLGVDA